MKKKLLGIDYGEKNVGIAISNKDRTVAFPKKVVDARKAREEVMSLCESEDIGGIVLGESTDYKGKDNEIMKDIREFKAKLEEALDIPIYFEPEFLTTAQAARGQEKRGDLDAAAAAVILRSFLDKQSKTDE